MWTRAELRERVNAGMAESLGTASENARQHDRADSLYRAALQRYAWLGEKRRRAWVLGSMGRNAFGAGRLEYADSVYRAALAARQEIGDLRMTGASWNALGSTAVQRGRFAEARDAYRQARAIRERTGERAALAQTLSFLGLAYRGLGEPDSARLAFGDALELAAALGDSVRVLETLVNLSDLLGRYGDAGEVESVERRGLAIARERGLADREVAIHLNALQAFYRLGRFTEARRRAERALAVEGASPSQQLDAWSELGRVYLKLADARAARPPLERARALADSLGSPGRRSQALNNLGIAASLEGDDAGCERLAREALDAGMEAGDSLRVQASLVTLANVASRRGDRRAAERASARAAGISASLGPQIHSTDLAGWAEAVLDRPDEAERLFERAREEAVRAGAPIEHAVALLGLGEVAERRGDFARAVARARAAATLLDTTRTHAGARSETVSLASDWRFAFDALIHLLVKLDARAPDSGYAAEAFHWAERARSRALLDLVAGAGRARPLTLGETAAWVRERDATLLHYAFGDSSTTLWVIGKDRVRHHTLPGRAALATRIEALRRGLADPGRALSRGTLAAAHALYRLLIEPARESVGGERRVIVSPDGPLALIPFEALLASAPREGHAPDAGDWLGSRWAISYAFSATTLAARTGAAGGGGGGVIALAAPEFGGALPALPHTAQEQRALESLAGERGVRYSGLQGRDATRERLLAQPGLREARLLHFATHGVADEIEPDRSGLWLAADTSGAPGFLSVADVAGLRLGADLVTLSACETGLGRLERGEGVVGLTRAFVAAGARSVVVSLWRVNDRSSSLLMESFYRELLAKRRTRDQALAEARRALMKSAETASPFYWAPFVLVGESGPVSFARAAARRSALVR